ncbi:MAG: ribosomal protein [Chloroflexota bacterium]|jgi:hypothetical protein
MTSKRAQVAEAPPIGADDLKHIQGIGRGVESRIHAAGVLTYADLAQLTPEQLAGMLVGLAHVTADRIEKQDWIGQARALARESAESVKLAERDGTAQQLEVFTVELLLGEDRSVRRTRVRHVKSGADEVWAGWDEARLAGTVAAHAELGAEASQASVGQTVRAGQTRGDLPALNVHQVEVITPEKGSAHSLLRAGSPYTVQVMAELDGEIAEDDALDYMAHIYMRQMGSGNRQLAGEAHGELHHGGRIVIDVPGVALKPGLYRLEAVVMLKPRPDEHMPRAIFEGRMLQVF